ncbi:MAG TPA: hypothetical protein VFF40_04975 [Acidimicrobiia bacterium]|nr:hypothetical protein [Acidimicrobiia bacterium]
MAQLRKRPASSDSSRWVTDPMARLLFKVGPPRPAQQGQMPPFPFESLDQMRDAWFEVRAALLPDLLNELGPEGGEPWAEGTWGAG